MSVFDHLESDIDASVPGFLPNYVTSGKSVTTTILRCGIAIGTTIPPYYTLAGKRLLLELLKDAAPGTDASMSDSRWSNTDIFRRFLMEHFIKYIPQVRKKFSSSNYLWGSVNKSYTLLVHIKNEV
jgi:hypothetical protein